jgi:phosphoadenosine phosphosulfate reductase
LLTRVYPDLPVIWIDTGYNTAATYRYAEALRAELDLNLLVYSPRVTVARRSALGGVPRPHNRQFERFARESKLEPFERAFNELKPDVWFTGIRREQTALRATLGVVSRGAHNSLRVAPLYAWDDTQLTRYLVHHGLADNDDYVDPTKPGAHLECGLHTLA